MVKNVTILILIIILSSCLNKNSSKIDNTKIIFRYNKFITVDFETQMLKIDYAGLNKILPISISKVEDSLIISSFSKNKIEEIKGEFSYPDCNWLMPSFEDKFEIYENQKLKSTIFFNENSNCPLQKTNPDSKEYRITNFVGDIKKVLENNSDFKRALDTLNKFRKHTISL
ncbi:hypothetical protein [Flavobacterium algicola]|uniref:hypothetical protein n=1 Tax=Flavobacterium algicola TaxID=556529 RepID=UPI001EFEE107|nr:hypothetical protein [Flavobacterium algicola]MCG9791984.1 hypothetical protein [Flavobacterium algicola]